MKLHRLKAGAYSTRDGRFEIVRDPTGGDQPLGWGYSSWLIFDNEDEWREALMLPPWGNQFPTLRDAKLALANYLSLP